MRTGRNPGRNSQLSGSSDSPGRSGTERQRRGAAVPGIALGCALLVATACSPARRPDAGPRAGPSGTSSDLRREAASVAATVETAPSPGDADDPAIWVHPRDPAKSLIIGTDKDSGLGVYTLDGAQVQFVAQGEPNNVDLRDGFRSAGREVSLVVAADDENRRLWVYEVDAGAGRLVDVAARPITTEIEAHGLCLYRSSASGRFYAFPNDQDGRTEQWELYDAGSGRVDARRVRGPWDVGGSVEGCVADDERGLLYIGEEERGIWKYDAEPDAPTDARRLVDSTGPSGHLEADVEGLAIRYGPGEGGLLIASSQGDSSFVVYSRSGNNAFLGKLRVRNGGIDGCDETDGIDVEARPLGPDFPAGLFVCHDGSDHDEGRKTTNFKLVPLDHFEAAIPVPAG